MSYNVGDSYSDIFVLRDNTGTGISGKVLGDFAVAEAYVVDSPATTTPVTITSIGSGEYSFSFTPPSAGNWIGHVYYDSGGVQVEWITDPLTFVVPVSSGSSVSVSSSARTTTLASLRKRIAEMLGDFVEIEITANGTTTQAISTIAVNTGRESYNGSELYFPSGTNIGHIATPTATDKATGTITYTPASPVASVDGEFLHIYNKRSEGWRVREYNRFINGTIFEAYPQAAVELTATITTPIDANDPVIILPDEVLEVHSVEINAGGETWNTIPRAMSRLGSGWTPSHDGTIILSRRYALSNDALDVRVLGYGRSPDLVVDTDSTPINPDWIVNQTCYRMLMAGMDRDMSRANIAMEYERQALRLRATLATSSRRRPGNARVRAI